MCRCVMAFSIARASVFTKSVAEMTLKGHSQLCDRADLDTSDKSSPQPGIKVHMEWKSAPIIRNALFLLDFKSFTE